MSDYAMKLITHTWHVHHRQPLPQGEARPRLELQQSQRYLDEADLKGGNTAAPRQRPAGLNAGGFTADESSGGRGLTVGGGRAAGGNTTARSAQSSHREDERCWLKP
jgi:hypothetical protein